MMPVLVDAIGHSVDDSLGTSLMRKEAHRSWSPSYFLEAPLEHVGGADLLP